MQVCAMLDSNRSFALTETHRRRFREDGHVVVEELLSPSEAARCSRWLEDRVIEHDRMATDMEQTIAAASSGWRYVQNLRWRDPQVNGFVTARRFARLVAELLDVPALRLMRDQSYFKAPGADATPWHQDAHWIPLDTDKIATLWLSLVDMSTDMGAIQFMSATHREGALGTSSRDPVAMRQFAQRMKSRGFTVSSASNLSAGDATVHAGWTLHAAPSNRSAHHRQAYVMVYFADGARVDLGCADDGFASKIRGDLYRQYFAGIPEGAPAASDLTPLVYCSAGRGPR